MITGLAPMKPLDDPTFVILVSKVLIGDAMTRRLTWPTNPCLPAYVPYGRGILRFVSKASVSVSTLQLLRITNC